MLKAFKKLGTTDRSRHLTLAGALSPTDGLKTVDELRAVAKGQPVTVLTNAPRSLLESEFARASILWHGTGLNVNIATHPEHAEHFGIVPLEAMARGVVPFVFNAGGPREYISHGFNGFVYNSLTELVDLTMAFYSFSNEEVETIRRNAIETAAAFSPNAFGEAFAQIFTLKLGEISGPVETYSST